MPRTTHVAHVWVDDFFVRVERQANRALEGLPVVIGGSPGSSGRVVAASVEAIACGVPSWGQPRGGEATVPGCGVSAWSARAGARGGGPGGGSVRRVAGPVEWRAIDEAVLDLAPLDRTRARRIAEEVRTAVRAAGHDAAVGVADTRTGARVAARLARPQGVLVVLPGCDARFLAGLDLACLGELDGAALDCLRAAGVHTLAELGGLPANDIASLLGREGGVLARRAAGVDPRPVTPTAYPRRVCRLQRFVSPPDTIEALRVVADLADSAASALHQFACVAGVVSLRAEAVDGHSLGMSVDLDAATARADLIPSTLTPRAPRLLAGREVRALAVSLGRLTQTHEQLALFDGSRATSARRW